MWVLACASMLATHSSNRGAYLSIDDWNGISIAEHRLRSIPWSLADCWIVRPFCNQNWISKWNAQLYVKMITKRLRFFLLSKHTQTREMKTVNMLHLCKIKKFKWFTSSMEYCSSHGLNLTSTTQQIEFAVEIQRKLLIERIHQKNSCSTSGSRLRSVASIIGGIWCIERSSIYSDARWTISNSGISSWSTLSKEGCSKQVYIWSE